MKFMLSIVVSEEELNYLLGVPPKENVETGKAIIKKLIGSAAVKVHELELREQFKAKQAKTANPTNRPGS